MTEVALMITFLGHVHGLLANIALNGRMKYIPQYSHNAFIASYFSCRETDIFLTCMYIIWNIWKEAFRLILNGSACSYRNS